MTQTDTLLIQRSQPVQGAQVAAKVFWNGVAVGELTLPFTGWIKINRLLQKGTELDQREGGQVQVRYKVSGDGAVTLPKAVSPVRTPVVKPLQTEEFDPDIAAAERQAKLDEAQGGPEQQAAQPLVAVTADELVKSLRGEG
jgi:hypothetical protein